MLKGVCNVHTPAGHSDKYVKDAHTVSVFDEQYSGEKKRGGYNVPTPSANHSNKYERGTCLTSHLAKKHLDDCKREGHNAYTPFDTDEQPQGDVL